MPKRDLRSLLATVVAATITSAWTLSFIIDIVNPAYDPPASLTPLMLGVAGFCFGGEFVLSRRNKGGNGE